MKTFSLKWHVDSELPVPLKEQIKGQIIYAIIYGQIKPLTRLPSVRELSSLLKVSTMTVSKVYHELVADGLVVSQPKIGYFVATLDAIHDSVHGRVTQKNLRQILENGVRQAFLLGYSIEEIRNVFYRVADEHSDQHKSVRVILVGNFNPATLHYAADIESIIGKKNIIVIPILFQDLVRSDPQIMEIVCQAGLILTPAHRLQDVRTLLQSYNLRIAAVEFEIHRETLERLSRISFGKKIGIVTTYPEFLQTMIDQVAFYGLPITPSLCAVLGQDDHIHKMMNQIDILVYASGSESILSWVPENLETIEFRNTPEPGSVSHLLDHL